MPQFCWTAGSEAVCLVEAEDKDQAYRIVLANRIKALGQDPNTAPRSAVLEAANKFRAYDCLDPVESELGTRDGIFLGELPTVDEIERDLA